MPNGQAESRITQWRSYPNSNPNLSSSQSDWPAISTSGCIYNNTKRQKQQKRMNLKS